MRRFLKLTAASLIAGLALHGTAFAQTFSAASIEYAKEAQALQGQNAHNKAIKQLKKGLKLDGLSAYETSTMYQIMGASYYAQGKNDKAIEAFENAINAGGLSQKDKGDLKANVAQFNIAEKNFALGAQQLEAYFREGGAQRPKLVKMIVQAYMRSQNRAAAVPWAEVMLRQGLIETKSEHDVAIYLFDSPEKRASQIRVANNMVAKWPNDPSLAEKIARLNVKAKIDGVAGVRVPGELGERVAIG